ncbi:MAG: hypothetical protein UF067_10790, partial [Paludibacteraceae bacterium]|nr:hypothetical protein [Paludibacteraceae bacterium]
MPGKGVANIADGMSSSSLNFALITQNHFQNIIFAERKIQRMEQTLKNLPIGIQDFESLIN